jgi:hypothetical protein
LVSLLDWIRAVTKKYLLAISLLCAGVGLSSGAVANQPSVEANQKIHNCIEGARQAGLYPGRCVGLIADPCINSAKDKDRAADKAKECAARELKIWAARLDKSLAAIKRADADISLTVGRAQKAWGPADELCPVFDRLDPGAALGAGEYCRLQATAARALLIEGLELSVSEH